MNVKIKKDADDLLQYYKGYSLKQNLDNSIFVENFKSIHKKIFGFLVVVAEIKYQNVKTKEFQDKPLEYLEESVSDVLEVFFAWINGAYKAANLLLRSSIENFTKFAIGCEDEAIFCEKNVYQIFKIAKEKSQLNIIIDKGSIADILHRVYGELCKSTHTATSNDMEHLTSLDVLPKWNKDDSKKIYENISLVTNAVLAYFLANNKKYINNMYRENKDIFYDTIPSGIIKAIEKERIKE